MFFLLFYPYKLIYLSFEYFFKLNKQFYCISHFATTLAFSGNFFEALISTFCACSLSRPLTSHIIFHFLTGALYISTSPFPFPIGISSPIFVNGTSGNTLNRIFHTFLVCLTITFLAASSCLFDTYSLLIAFNPYSPKATVLHLVLFPFKEGIICFLCFRLLGVNNILI